MLNRIELQDRSSRMTGKSKVILKTNFKAYKVKFITYIFLIVEAANMDE
jgi:hypothetical protein